MAGLRIRFDSLELDEADVRLKRDGNVIALVTKDTLLDNVTTGQSVMLATNEIFLYVTVAFCLGACLIWLAPKPTRTVSLAEAGTLKRCAR